MSQRQSQILSQSLSGLRTEHVEATLPGLYEWYRKTFEKAGWIILAIHKSSSKPEYATKVAAYVSGTNRLIDELKTRLSDPKNNQTIVRDFPNMIKDLEELKGFMSTMGNALKQAPLSNENVAVQDKSLYGLYKWFKHVFEKFGWMVLVLNKLKYGAYVNQPTLETYMRNKLIMYSQSLEILYKSLEARKNSSNDLDIDNVKIDINSMLRNLTILRNCAETNMIETPASGMVVRPIAPSQIVVPSAVQSIVSSRVPSVVPSQRVSGRSGTLTLDSPTSTVGSATAAILPANLSVTSAAPVSSFKPTSFRAADSVTSPIGSATAAVATADLSATSSAPVPSSRVSSRVPSSLKASAIQPSISRVPSSLRASIIQPPTEEAPLSQSSSQLLAAAAQAPVLSASSQTLIPMSDTPVSPIASRIPTANRSSVVQVPSQVPGSLSGMRVPSAVPSASLQGMPLPSAVPASLSGMQVPSASLQGMPLPSAIPSVVPSAVQSAIPSAVPASLSGMQVPSANLQGMPLPSAIPSAVPASLSGMQSPPVSKIASTLGALSRAASGPVVQSELFRSARELTEPVLRPYVFAEDNSPQVTFSATSNSNAPNSAVRTEEANAISRLLQAQSASQSAQTATQTATQTAQTLSATSPVTATASSSSTLF